MTTTNTTTDYLEYKNHEQWFRDLNTNLQSARKLGENMLLDSSMINIFYNKIKILKSSYSSYFDINAAKDINSKLFEIEKDIRTPSFIKSVKVYGKLKETKKQEFSEILWRNIDNLLLVFELINSELKREELMPKPKTKRNQDPNKAILGGY